MDHEQASDIRERLSRLWMQAEPSVNAYVFAAVQRFEDAEDVVQQVALTAARRFEEYDDSRPFVAWVLWLAKSKIIDHYRVQGRQKLVKNSPANGTSATVSRLTSDSRAQRGAAWASGGSPPKRHSPHCDCDFLDSAQTVSEFAGRSHAVNVDHGQLVGRHLNRFAVVMSLDELAPVGGWAPGGRDWWWLGRFAALYEATRVSGSSGSGPAR